MAVLEILVCFSVFGLITFISLMIITKLRRRQQVSPGVRAVLITGCDHGFGYHLAKKLDSKGFKVFAGCLDADGNSAKQLNDLTSSKLEILQLDVTKDDQIDAARGHIGESLNGTVLWALVNNAGVAYHAEFEWFSSRDFANVMDVNFTAVVKLTRTFLPLIRASQGRIINIASMAGRTALPGFTAYSASKAAVIAFSDSLRREMSHFRVKVIVLEPAMYKTDILCSSKLMSQNEKYWADADPGIKRDYGNIFFQATQNARERITKFANSNVEEVVDCFVEAVTSRNPKTRYVTPFSLRILNDFFSYTLLPIQDYVIKHVTGIKSKPDMMNPLLNAEGGRLGRRRSHAT